MRYEIIRTITATQTQRTLKLMTYWPLSGACFRCLFLAPVVWCQKPWHNQPANDRFIVLCFLFILCLFLCLLCIV